MKKTKLDQAMAKKMILAAIREHNMLPRPIRDHIGETSHGHEDLMDHFTLTLESGRRVSVECATVPVGSSNETFVYDIIELK